MTDKERIAYLDEKVISINSLFKSEKQMNETLKKHIENLEFQISTQSNLMEEFCRKIAELRIKLKNIV
tara:strand:- start:670 stop:873 length:204 start_codon:yes stop_codon:yes gene_type:complete